MSNKQKTPILDSFIICLLLIIPLIIIHYITPKLIPKPLPNVTMTINLINPTGTKVQTWNYTGIPVKINYPDIKGIGTLINAKGEHVILDDQPVYVPIGWYLQIK